MQRGDQVVTIVYDTQQRPIKWQNQLGQTITATYNDRKQQIIYHTYDGQQIISRYDTEGQLVDYQWQDKQGNVLVQSNIAPQQTVTANASTPSKSVDPVAKAITKSVSTAQAINSDTDFEPAQALLKTEAVINIETNPLGDIKKISLPEGATYERIYDDFGRVIYAKDANTGISTIEYDLNDQPTAITSPSSTQIANYDDLGRLTSAKYCQQDSSATITSAQACENITYQYDGAHLSKIVDPIQTTQYTYDTQGRLTVESVQFNDSDNQWQTSYHYDDKGRLHEALLPEGAKLTYTYNNISTPDTILYQPPATGWLTRLIRTINPDHNSTVLLSNIQGDSARGLLSFTHNNGKLAKADYDKAGRISKWQDGDYYKALTYDQNNLITAVDSKQGEEHTQQQLSYNTYGELIHVRDDTNQQSHEYDYDLNGNRLSLIQPSAHTKYTYQKGTDRLLSMTEVADTANQASAKNKQQHTTYRYDGEGNPVAIMTQVKDDPVVKARTFTYGARGQLKQIKDGKQSTDYRYNHAMQRVSKTTSSNNKDKDEQRFLWQQGLLDAEIDMQAGKAHLSRRYIYIGLRPVAVIDYDQHNTPSVYSVHTDHLGTPQRVTDANQKTVWQGSYDAFGQVTVKATLQDKMADVQARQNGWSLPFVSQAHAETAETQSKPFEFNLRFAGQYEDKESGYYYNWHRYYNPKTGRYLTSDPIGLNGGLNTYGYANQNPVMSVDPWGLYTIFIGGAGDHESFLGSGPTGIIEKLKDRFVSDFLLNHIQSSGYTQERSKYLANRHARYYGYNEIHLALTHAKTFLDYNPDLTLNIVGHSLGGWQAAHLAQQINDYRCNSVDNLITLDPVGASYRIHLVANIKFKVPKPVSKTWVNVRAELDGTTSINNIIANLGKQWVPTDDNQTPDFNYQLNTDHALAETMLTRNIIGQKFSPWDLLKMHYQQLPHNFNYENVPSALTHGVYE